MPSLPSPWPCARRVPPRRRCRCTSTSRRWQGIRRRRCTSQSPPSTSSTGVRMPATSWQCRIGFMILPVGAKSFTEAMKMGSEVYHHLKAVIKKKYGQDACNVGDEGGFAPNILANEEGLNLVVEAIEKAGYTGKVKIGMDVAASEFYTEDKMYDLDFKTEGDAKDKSQKISGDKLTEMYKSFCANYPVISIEDPFDQDDFDAYGKMTTSLGVKCQVVGDDLLVTNPKRVQKAIDEKACNALLLKVNQIGSVSESIEAVALAKSAGWGVMTSHRIAARRRILSSRIWRSGWAPARSRRVRRAGPSGWRSTTSSSASRRSWARRGSTPATSTGCPRSAA
ncbi:unnamed protein product [Prorocentrum cordatum]|uniref:phosphopyruvate hydratase n=1 Tax=Prorocentrum cordatum TaxID=2364126 RepID=A0ABN9PW92_9DINO|nr:unnamed protein product [Polarella glacialis]